MANLSRFRRHLDRVLDVNEIASARCRTSRSVFCLSPLLYRTIKTGEKSLHDRAPHLLVKLLVPEVNVRNLGSVLLAQPPLSLQLVPLRVEGVQGPGEAHLDEKVPDEVIHDRGPHLRNGTQQAAHRSVQTCEKNRPYRAHFLRATGTYTAAWAGCFIKYSSHDSDQMGSFLSNIGAGREYGSGDAMWLFNIANTKQHFVSIVMQAPT